MNDDDAHLLRLYSAEGSQAAFTEVVNRRFDLVYSAALRQLRGDAHGARDVAQTVFCDLARKAAELSRHTSLMGWLFTSTYYAACKRQRDASRRAVREEAAASDFQPSTEPRWETIRPILDAELNRLKPADREALLQRFFSGQSFDEVGAAAGLSAGAARMRVDRALDRLRAALARQGITSTSAALGLALAQNAVSAAPAGLSTLVASQAIAQAALGASTLASVSIFAMSKLSSSLVAAALAAALCTGWYYAEHAAALRQTAQQLAADNAHLRRSIPSLTPEDSLLLRHSSGAQAHRPNSATRSSPAAADEFSTDAVQREVAEGPALRTALAKLISAQFRLAYGPLFQRLGLSEEQIKQLSLLNLKAVSEREDLVEANRRSGGAAGPDSAFASMQAAVSNRFDQAVTALLGPAGSAQFQSYSQTLPAREILNQALAATTYSASPLTATQSDSLVQLIAQSHGQPDWPAVMNQARGFLTPEQLASLQASRAQTTADDLERNYSRLNP